ncbi:amidohydrolase [Kwoniella heveanensis BCC8398]|uniref:Amidohydrolase n=1 Tax=Kwoniella heveanensis BCC8398 TaxID=1296120 RepID=A0A1B9GI34_9TREE|nr:amidohydrolase [Kwoniella heveanensis BCC8398]
MHSHMGVDAAPSLQGNDDTNSLKNAVLPWLRSLDGFNTHDLAFNLSISGGITTMLVLPGSAGNIGGQAFPFKPRWTYENTPQSMLVEPAFVIDNGTWSRTHAWRHIKHACGENPHRVYGNTRMDSAYDFRRAYTEGKELKEKQDRWCKSPKTQTEPFPTSLEWEALSDVIRGNVKVNIHCYETTDLNTLVRISNEFQFPIAAFHHAHEAYLVPDLLKQAWGPEPPAVAIFSTNARYKREAYRGSEFAPKVLAEAGLSVVMKSDHPVLDSRYLISEASFAHHYGLNTSLALSSVTTHPAKALGLDHRIGYLREGYDADVVVWDSHPLTVGATPKQTYIDGIPQIIKPVLHHKPAQVQKAPPTGKWDKEAREAVEARGDPDLRPKKSSKNVIFQDVSDFHLFDQLGEKLQVDVSAFEEGKGSVLVQDGEITCAGNCKIPEGLDFDFELVDLRGGAITPGFITVGSRLGQIEIRQEKATADGTALDPLDEGFEITDGLLAHAVDGAQFGGKDELLAYRSGVTTAVVSPKSSSFFSGISFAFSPSAPHPLSHGAIQNSNGALHITLDNSKTSVSSKIAILRRLLLGDVQEETELSEVLKEVAKGKLRLVVNVDKADSIATLIRLKNEVAHKAKITVLGGQEAWLVADELAEADIGVIVAPVRSYPGDWDSRRIIPSVPLSNHTLPSYLVSHGVTVGLGIVEEWQARNTLYEAAWVYASSPPGVFTKRDALDLVGKNLETLLGLKDGHHRHSYEGESQGGWVAHEGDVFSLGGKVKAVRGVGQVAVDLF